MSSEHQSAGAASKTPPQPSARMTRAILRDLREKGPAFVCRKTAENLRRRYQFSRYRYNLRRLSRSPDSVPIDRPIFILGTQGGGATILARCLHRHPEAVYPSGNSNFWAGPDELHNCPHLYDMPEPLIHRSYHFGTVTEALPHHPRYGYQRAWLYAVDEMLPTFQKGAGDVDPTTTARFRRVIQNVILAYAHDPDSCRFVDKSQLYTIQVPYISEMLADCNPHFVLLTRNPYATCARAVAKEYGRERGGYIESDLEARIDCAVEHWSNTFGLALKAQERVPMLQVRYEDFLEEPEATLRRIGAFAGLEFSPGQVPGPNQPAPLGSSDAQKWYPLRPAENERYLREIDPRLVTRLNRRSTPIIERLGYEILRV